MIAKLRCIAIFILIFPTLVLGQGKKRFAFKYAICGFTKQLNSQSIETLDPDDKVRGYVDTICRIAGIQDNFVIRQGPIEIALATMDDSYNRIILYSSEYFKSDSSGVLNENQILVLAHEIGHFLNNNILPKDNRRITDELDADKFAGGILCKMGLGLTSGLKFLSTVCPNYSDGLYPRLLDRQEAVTLGFHKSNCGKDYDPPDLHGSDVLKLFRSLNKNAILFEYDSSVLAPSSYPMLDALSAEARVNPSLKILLKGYYYLGIIEDGNGNTVQASPEHDLRLSKDAANSVKTYLVNSGVDAKRITVKGFGRTNPLMSFDTEVGRILQRRVEIELKDDR